MGDDGDDIFWSMDEPYYDEHISHQHRSRLNAARYFFLPTLFQPRKPMPAKPQRVSIKTPLFRGSFVNLAKARARENDDGTPGKEQFSMLIVVPKGKKSTRLFIEELSGILLTCAQEKHGSAITQKRLKHWPIKDGDESEKEQFHGHYLINAASNFKPSVIDANGDELTTGEELYSGAWYKAKISPWAWANKKGGKGVSVNLESAIKIKDDDRFGGGSKASDDFADEVGGDSDEDGEDEKPAKAKKKKPVSDLL